MQQHSNLLVAVTILLIVSACSYQVDGIDLEGPCANMQCGEGLKCIEDWRDNARCVCNTRCGLVREPVCGTDGRTYSNYCVLDLAICQSGGDISAVCGPDGRPNLD